MTVREKAFAKKIFAKFIFAIFDDLRKNLFRKIKLMLPLTKNSMIFRENIQKLDSICKNLFCKIQCFWVTE